MHQKYAASLALCVLLLLLLMPAVVTTVTLPGLANLAWGLRNLWCC